MHLDVIFFLKTDENKTLSNVKCHNLEDTPKGNLCLAMLSLQGAKCEL